MHTDSILKPAPCSDFQDIVSDLGMPSGVSDLVLLVTLPLSGFVFTVLDGDWIRCSAVVDPSRASVTLASHGIFYGF